MNISVAEIAAYYNVAVDAVVARVNHPSMISRVAQFRADMAGNPWAFMVDGSNAADEEVALGFVSNDLCKLRDDNNGIGR